MTGTLSTALTQGVAALAADTPVVAPIADPAHTHEMVVTIGVAISIGGLLIVLARRLQLPGIVMLLLGGIGLGPEGLGWVNPTVFGDGLLVIVSLAVGIILFEGGLTLDTSGYRSVPPVMIKRLLSVGILITWSVTATAIWLFTGQPLQIAIVAASLVIVTGPTVIAPLLQRLKIAPRVHAILHWEGVLIDPIGVFIALLCFEYVVTGASGLAAATNLGERVIAGLAFGILGGIVVSQAVVRGIVPTDLRNVFALAGAILVFALAEMVHAEAGLLAVTAAGFVFALVGGRKVRYIREFKAEITHLLIGTLFILLAARLELDQFQSFGLSGLAVVAVVMLIARPLGIALCSLGTDLPMRERLFLSWVAPRGIVAASMASLFAISIEAMDPAAADSARFVETFVYSVIIATIVIQGFSAGPIATLLGLREPEPRGWMIVGAHPFSRGIAEFIRRVGDDQVVLIDTNARNVRTTKEEGFTAITADARDTGIRDQLVLAGAGNVLALTDNEDLNARLCHSWSEIVGAGNVYRIETIGGANVNGQSDEDNGVVVWPGLPKPSLLAAEITRGDTILGEMPGDPPPRRGSVLMARLGNTLVINPRAETLDGATKDDVLLVLRRRVDDLSRAMHSSLIIDIDAGDLSTTVRMLLDRMVQTVPSIPRDRTLSELLEREAAVPNALGEGVAVPHSYVTDLDRRLVGLARLKTGFDHGAPDGKPIRLVFLLLSPDGDPEGHLATLAEIARRMINPEIREQIMTVPTPEDVMRIIRETRSSA